MLEFLDKVPVFIWPLFAFLLIGGLKARKTNTMPLAVMVLFPAIVCSWSLYSFFSQYGFEPVKTLLWGSCLSIGIVTGFSHMQKLELGFDRKKMAVIIPGSWIPLILSMSIFTSKFTLRMMAASLPEQEGSLLFFGLELFAITLLGVFAGRGASCVVRYREGVRA